VRLATSMSVLAATLRRDPPMSIPMEAVVDTTDGMESPKTPQLPRPTEAVEHTMVGTESPKSHHTPNSADGGTVAATHNVDPAI